MKQIHQKIDIYLQKKGNKLFIDYDNIITEYQKIIIFLDNALIQPSKFRTKVWFKIHDESRGTYNTNCQIKFKTTMLKSSLCDYSDAYILVKGTITVLNNTQIDKAKDIGIVMPMYNLIGYCDNYSKTSGSLWQYCKDIPAVITFLNLMGLMILIHLII